MEKQSIAKYLSRSASPTPILGVPIHPQCQTIIVIPCHNEADLTGTLQSLTECTLPQTPVEVIVVVNQSLAATAIINRQNQLTIREFLEWSKEFESSQKGKTSELKFHLIEALDMPAKHAGVGLARKTGMDEALRRFASIGVDGAIVCLDADCRVSKSYLTAIESEFSNSRFTLGEMHFEHLWQQESDLRLQSGIINYELFLRYYVEGLRQAGFPNAIHTIGSCMLVKASAYARHGGMNRRKAGEDFYFLHKLVPHEPFTTVTAGTVYPSCRTSDRVPFGTGKAQQDWVNRAEDTYHTYDPFIFELLKGLLKKVNSLFNNTVSSVIQGLDTKTRQFLEAHDYVTKIELIKKNCRTESQFIRQFFTWFDGFICMKFMHFMRDHFHPDIPISKAARILIDAESEEVTTLLEEYRIRDLQLAASPS